MITTPPKKKKINKKKIDEIISKGSSAPTKDLIKKKPNEEVHSISLRPSIAMVKAIDEKRRSKYGGKSQSRHSFILQAIEKALEE
ncbi:MAG: hypothetical protein AAF443_07840 [Chlamydiota bacterium]